MQMHTGSDSCRNWLIWPLRLAPDELRIEQQNRSTHPPGAFASQSAYLGAFAWSQLGRHNPHLSCSSSMNPHSSLCKQAGNLNISSAIIASLYLAISLPSFHFHAIHTTVIEFCTQCRQCSLPPMMAFSFSRCKSFAPFNPYIVTLLELVPHLFLCSFLHCRIIQILLRSSSNIRLHLLSPFLSISFSNWGSYTFSMILTALLKQLLKQRTFQKSKINSSVGRVYRQRDATEWFILMKVWLSACEKAQNGLLFLFSILHFFLSTRLVIRARERGNAWHEESWEWKEKIE